MDSELAITKQVNVVLKESVHSLQKRINEMDQYTRRDNIEVSGVPENVSNLEEKAIELFKKIDVKVSPQDIVACHPLKRKGTIIIRFLNRKNAEKALKNRSQLRNVNTAGIWGQHCNNYINTNLSPENLKLRWFSKKLHAAQVIAKFGTDTKGVWIVPDEGGRKKRILSKEDLECLLLLLFILFYIAHNYNQAPYHKNICTS